jgi:hypothetical protein
MNASVADSDTTRKYRPWFAFFLFWVLFNEALSHSRPATLMRLRLLKVTCFYFMICRETLRKKGSPQFIIESGRREASSSRHCLFDSKILGHVTNIIAAIIYEITHLPTSQSASLQRIETAPGEKLSSIIRIHAKTHQTASRILSCMEVDQAMQTVHPIRIVRKRKLASEEIVGNVFGDVTHFLLWELPLQAEVFLEFVAFPIPTRR